MEPRKHRKIAVLIPLILMIISSSAAQTSNFNPMLSVKEKQAIEAGEIIMREVETKQDRGQTIETIGFMRAPGDSLVKLLTDYADYPRFMAAVDVIEIVDRSGDETTLNYILRPMLGLTKKYRIRIAPHMLAEQVWKIEWSKVEWPGLSELETIGDTQGYWLIIEQSPSRCLIQYYVYTDPGLVPFGLGGIVDAIGRDSIEEVFMETRTEALKMMGSQ